MWRMIRSNWSAGMFSICGSGRRSHVDTRSHGPRRRRGRALTQAAEVVGEVNGRFDTREDEPDRPSTSRGAVRLGARYTVGGWRGDAALVFGLTSRDPGIGFAAGFTYVFQAFQIP